MLFPPPLGYWLGSPQLSLTFFKICQICLTSVSLHMLFSVLEMPLSLPLYYLIFTHLSGLRLKATSFKRPPLNPQSKQDPLLTSSHASCTSLCLTQLRVLHPQPSNYARNVYFLPRLSASWGVGSLSALLKTEALSKQSAGHMLGGVLVVIEGRRVNTEMRK